jgi:hypothetical protein
MLYLFSAEFRRKSEYRVTYINNCQSWRNDELDYFLKELITTFHNDGLIGGKTIKDWCEVIFHSPTSKKMKDNMHLLIDALIIFINQNNLQWVVICDQHNAMFAGTAVVGRFPFNIIQRLADNRGQSIKILISASTNNGGHPTEMIGWDTFEFPTSRFDDDEFRVWCENYWLSEKVQVDPYSEDARSALYWSGKDVVQKHFISLNCKAHLTHYRRCSS